MHLTRSIEKFGVEVGSSVVKEVVDALLEVGEVVGVDAQSRRVNGWEFAWSQ